MEEEDDGQNKCSFEQIVGLQSLRDCEKLRVNLQNIIDLAIESELDQLMIFADDNLDASATKVGSTTSGLLHGLVERFKAAKAITTRLGCRIAGGGDLSAGEKPPLRPPRRGSGTNGTGDHNELRVETASSTSTVASERNRISIPEPVDSPTALPPRPPRKSLNSPVAAKRGSLHDLMRANLSESMEELAFDFGN